MIYKWNTPLKIRGVSLKAHVHIKHAAFNPSWQIITDFTACLLTWKQPRLPDQAVFGVYFSLKSFPILETTCKNCHGVFWFSSFSKVIKDQHILVGPFSQSQNTIILLSVRGKIQGEKRASVFLAYLTDTNIHKQAYVTLHILHSTAKDADNRILCGCPVCSRGDELVETM